MPLPVDRAFAGSSARSDSRDRAGHRGGQVEICQPVTLSSCEGSSSIVHVQALAPLARAILPRPLGLTERAATVFTRSFNHSERQVVQEEAHTWTLRAGKIVRYEWGRDLSEALEAVGLRE